MTLVASAHRHDLDVQEYLRDVIEHLNRGTAPPSELLPDVWKASHPEAVRTYREVERRDKAELAPSQRHPTSAQVVAYPCPNPFPGLCTLTQQLSLQAAQNHIRMLRQEHDFVGVG